MTFGLEKGVERLKRLARAEQLEKVAAELFERVVVVVHDQRAIPSTEFAGHRHRRAVGVNDRALIEQVARDLLIVEDDDVKSKCA